MTVNSCGLRDRVMKEVVCSLITGLLAMPLGVLQFIPVYHSLHGSFQIHSEICVLLILTLYFLIAWTNDRRPSAQARTSRLSGIDVLSMISSRTRACLASDCDQIVAYSLRSCAIKNKTDHDHR